MRVLIAVKNAEDGGFFRRVAALAPLAAAEEILLVHVIDVTPSAGLEQGRERFLARRHLSEHRSAELRGLEEERARATLQAARQSLVAAGVAGERIRETTLRGKPKEAVYRLAEERGVDLIVVRGRPGETGPHSVGKTARFLLDHAPRAVLLVR